MTDSRPGIHITRFEVATIIFAIPASLMAIGLATVHGRTIAFVVIGMVAVIAAVRRHVFVGAVLIAITSVVLRLAYVGIGYSTQVDNARSAAERALNGLSPYGFLLPASTTPPEPYVYGPLALVWWQPGVVVEFAAAIGVMALLIWTRSWLTLALYAGLPFAVFLTTTGVNDYSPGFLIASALLLLRTHRLLGAGLLATAAAIKPYAFSWFLPAIGYAGWTAAAVLLGVTVVLWSPLAVWGPTSFVRSIQLHAQVHPEPANALNLPLLRWIAVPIAAIGLVVRRWDHMVLVGSLAFVAYLFLDRWASLGYWLAVLPIAGIALEQRFNSFGGSVRWHDRALT